MSALASHCILSQRDSSPRKLGRGFGLGHFLFPRVESRIARPSLGTQPLDHAFHNLTDRFPRHSSVLPRYGSTRTDGVVGSVPFVIGEIRNE